MKDTTEDKITLASLAVEYSDENEARKYFESIRWPNGPVCPHCGSKNHYALKPRSTSNRPCRAGLYKCKDCGKQYTVAVGTIFSDSKVPMRKWLLAFFLLSSSKKAMSAHQIHRSLGVTYKTAWFMCHRIRHAMKPMEEEKLSGTVEMDEAFIGGKGSQKAKVVSLIERGGEIRTKVVDRLTHKNIGPFVRENVAKGSTLNTDANPRLETLYLPAIKHDSVNHSENEYSREKADGSKVHVNNCESFTGLLKRGIMGAFHHISQQHLPRYCDEFAFRWNTRKTEDGERFETALGMTVDKRLKYRETTLNSAHV
jgi:transposase-like protein